MRMEYSGNIIKMDKIIPDIDMLVIRGSFMGKGLNLTKRDLLGLREEMRLNRKQRMEFVRHYAGWLKKAPNKVWSRQHKKFLDG